MSCNCNEPKEYGHHPFKQAGHSHYPHHEQVQPFVHPSHQGYMNDPSYQFPHANHQMVGHGGMPMQGQMNAYPPNAPISQYHETGFYGHMPPMNGFGAPHPGGQMHPQEMGHQAPMGQPMHFGQSPTMHHQQWNHQQGQLVEPTHPQLGARGGFHPNSYMGVDDEDL